MIFPYNSNNFWAYKRYIYSYSTIYGPGIGSEETGGPGGCPPKNKVPSAKENHVTNQWILSTYSPLKLKGSRACPPRIYSPRSDPFKTGRGSRGCPPRNASPKERSPYLLTLFLKLTDSKGL
jgi:hypothetical protein